MMIGKADLKKLMWDLKNLSIEAKKVHDITGDQQVFAESEGQSNGYSYAVSDLGVLYDNKEILMDEDVESLIRAWQQNIMTWGRSQIDTPYPLRKNLHQGKIDATKDAIERLEQLLKGVHY
jgi:hypothetical protein